LLERANADPGIESANGVLTIQVGPNQVLATLSAAFDDCCTTQQIEACVARIEQAARLHHPEIVALFVKPETPQAWQARLDALEPGSKPEPANGM